MSTFLNTDVLNYAEEFLLDGFKPSTTRLREFIPSELRPREMIIQDHCCNYFLNEKKRILYREPEDYVQSALTSYEEYDIAHLINSILPTGLHVHGDIQGINCVMEFVPCDLIFCQIVDGEPRLTYLHLVFPNDWSAKAGINQTFNYFHENVKYANGKLVVPTATKFVEHLIYSGKHYERIGGWHIRADNDLDRRPENTKPSIFENNNPIFLRFERQTTFPLPEHNGFLFFVHTHLVDFRAKPDTMRAAIVNADPECRIRDLLKQHCDYFLNYLDEVQK